MPDDSHIQKRAIESITGLEQGRQVPDRAMELTKLKLGEEQSSRGWPSTHHSRASSEDQVHPSGGPSSWASGGSFLPAPL